MRPIIFSIVILFLSLGLFAQKDEYKFKRLNISNGLINNQIKSIYVDGKGYAWFATIAGVARFDGHNYKVFTNNPSDKYSIPFNSVASIFEDHKGNLWFFNTYGEFSIYNPLTDKFSSNHELFSSGVVLPSNTITAIVVDSDSLLWVANSVEGIAVYLPKSNSVKLIQRKNGDNASPASNSIMDLKNDDDNNMVSVNRFGLVERIDKKSLKVIKRVQLKVANVTEITQNYKLFVDSKGNYWVYSQNDASGLYFYNRKTDQQVWFHKQNGALPLSSNIISGISEDAKGNVWVATDHGGINIIEPSTMSVVKLAHEQGDENSLAQNSVTSIFTDANGTVWVGTFKNGISYYHPGLFQFKLYKNNPFSNGSLPANDIDCFAEDAQGNLWIGTNGDGLIYYNRTNNSFKTFKHQPSNPNSLSSDVIVSLCVDSDNRLWVGTYYGGLNLYEDGRFTRFLHNPDDPRTIADNRIWAIYEDSKNRIWVATLGGGLDLYDKRSGRFTHFKSSDANSVHSDYILSLAEDSDGNLWIGTSSGIDVLENRTGRFVQYLPQPESEGSLSNGVCMGIVHDKRGWTWIGTRNGLNLFDKQSKTFRAFTVAQGLADNNIMSLQVDDEGNIWMGTLNGISNLQITDVRGIGDFEYRVLNYDTKDGLQGKEYNEHSGFKTKRGELMFGGANGFNLFVPSAIFEIEQKANIVLTDFKLQNKSVFAGDVVNGRTILDKSIGYAQHITLKHNQNVFAIEFSALNFLNPEKLKYRYKLEGFNNDWITTDAQNRLATYTNLNPGKYRFKVMVTELNGNWSNAEATIDITVIPPFYATKWALFLYGLLFVLLVLLLIRIIVRREHLKFQRKQERLEHERMHELDNMKIRFFTNISHEFRTPLTLILTPLEKLINKAPDDGTRGQLELIQRNGKRLLNLVNQLLDFRKMEVQRIVMNLSFDDIVYFLNETTQSFCDLSESKNIGLKFNASIDKLNVWFDPDKVEKVLFNLLNNAFKFTQANGEISVNVHLEHGVPELFNGRSYLVVKVADTGIGISRDKLDKIFERFFQVDGQAALMNQGSGIGLALTQEFVRLHQGTISVESELEKGSEFTVCLPVLSDADARAIDEHIDSKVAQLTENEIVDYNDADEPEAKADDKPVLLIVEDNEDLRFYLRENLRKFYIIDEATNGHEALKRINERQPMLVVTDVMMPVMDGLELCKRIKADSHTSHIPVVMLTARNTNEQKIEGLEIGADEYITKPFNYELLQIKIQRLISQRRDLQKSLHVHYEIKPGEIGVTSLDEKFLQKALALVEKNISKADFTVERMSKELGVSRGHLYNKTMALTGKTPIEFIRIMRLKRAAQLLGKSQLTVSEIAFEVGFNDPKYFSKYFKEEFNISPSDYAKAAVKGTLDDKK